MIIEREVGDWVYIRVCGNETTLCQHKIIYIEYDEEFTQQRMYVVRTRMGDCRVLPKDIVSEGQLVAEKLSGRSLIEREESNATLS